MFNHILSVYNRNQPMIRNCVLLFSLQVYGEINLMSYLEAFEFCDGEHAHLLNINTEAQAKSVSLFDKLTSKP